MPLNRSSSARSSRRRVGLAWLALVALPLVVAADNLWAVRQGWPSKAIFHLPAVTAGALAWSLACSFASLWPAVRLRMASWAMRLCALNVSLLMGLALSEYLLGRWEPLLDLLRTPLAQSYEFEPDPLHLPGVHGMARATLNRQRLRGPELPTEAPQTPRVFCWGDSTTACHYLDDNETWPAVLHSHLSASRSTPIWVGSAAHDQDAVAHHTRRLLDSPLLRPGDTLIVMCGGADLLRPLLGFELGDEQPPVWTRLRSAQLLDYRLGCWLGARLNVDREGRHISHVRSWRAIDMPHEEPRVDQLATLYYHRLERLVRAARARRARLVLVTQPTLWDSQLTPLALRKLRWARMFPYPRPWSVLRPDNLRQWLDVHHQALAELGRRAGVEVVDASTALSGQELLFYDDLHLNEAGCQALGNLLADYLLASTGDSSASPAPQAAALVP